MWSDCLLAFLQVEAGFCPQHGCCDYLRSLCHFPATDWHHFEVLWCPLWPGVHLLAALHHLYGGDAQAPQAHCVEHHVPLFGHPPRRGKFCLSVAATLPAVVACQYKVMGALGLYHVVKMHNITIPCRRQSANCDLCTNIASYMWHVRGLVSALWLLYYEFPGGHVSMTEILSRVSPLCGA